MAISEKRQKELLEWKRQQEALAAQQAPTQQKQPGSWGRSAFNMLEGLGGAIGSAGSAMAAPFIKTGTTALRAGRGGLALGEAAVRGLVGDTEGASKVLQEEGRAQRQESKMFGYQHRPVETVRETLGTGLQVGSTVAGMATPGASQLASSVLGAAGKGALLGGISGGLYGAGSGLTEGGGRGLSGKETLGMSASRGIIGTVTGAIVGGIAGGVGKALSNFDKTRIESKVTEDAAKKLQKQTLAKLAESSDPDTAIPAKINQVVAKIDEAKAVKFTVRDTDLIVGADPETRAVMKQMIDNADEAAASIRYPADQTPKGIAGQTLLAKAGKSMDLRQEAGKALGKVVADSADNTVNVSSVLNEFDDELLSSGAKFNPDGTLDFSSSAWKASKAAQDSLKGVRESIMDATNVGSAHVQKQVINETGKLLRQQKLLTSNTERIISNVKSGLVDAIDSSAKGYRQAATDYAVQSHALTEFERLMGRKFNSADEISKAIRAGEVSNRLASNTAGNAMVAINALDEATGGFGGSLRDQVAFAGLVEDLWHLKPERGFDMQIAKAAIGAKQALSGNPVSAFTELRGLFESPPDANLAKSALRTLVDSVWNIR